MTPEQRRLARHALGLAQRGEVYRNHYAATAGTQADAAWLAMCQAGLATVALAAPGASLRCYSLSEAGIRRVLELEAAE